MKPGISALRGIGRRLWRRVLQRAALRLPAITQIDLEYKEKPRDYRFPCHSHPHAFEIYYVDRGRIRISVGRGPRQLLEQQELLFLLPQSPHEAEGDPKAPASVMTLHFKSPDLLKLLPGLKRCAGRAIPFDPELYGLLNGICGAARAKGGGRRSAALLGSMLLRLEQLGIFPAPSRPARPGKAQFAGALEQFVKNHLEQPLDLKRMASALGCSVSTLTHEYRRLSGRSPRQLLLQLRVQKAKELLRQAGASAKEAARLSGFSSPSAFGRAFVAAEKMTPGAYRRRLSAALERGQ